MLGRHIVLASCILGLAIGGAAFCDEAGDSAATVSSNAAQAYVVKPSEPGKPYTSLIVDATGFDLQRCMSPKLRKPDGTEVWGTVKIDYDFVEEYGVVAYACSLDDARKNPRCGSNPLVVRAVAVYGGKLDSDPVISAEDAKLLMAENDKGQFFDKFKVIFIKGSTPPATAKAQ